MNIVFGIYAAWIAVSLIVVGIMDRKDLYVQDENGTKKLNKNTLILYIIMAAHCIAHIALAIYLFTMKG